MINARVLNKLCLIIEEEVFILSHIYIFCLERGSCFFLTFWI